MNYRSFYRPDIGNHILQQQGHWMGINVQELIGVKDNTNDTLYAFYDLEKSPSSFDIIPFLVLAENYRIHKTSCKSIHVVIVPGSNRGFRTVQNTDNWDLENKQWRLRNLLPDCCWLLPSCKGISVLETRVEAELIYSHTRNIFPVPNYSITYPVERYNWVHIFKNIILENKPIELPLRSSNLAKNKIQKWLDYVANGKKVITLNLRETVEVSRNSTIENWVSFYHLMNNQEFQPIFVRDAENNLSELPLALKNTLIFPEANHVELRMALYELSCLNMFVSNGTAAMAWFNPNVKYITFKLLSELPELTSCNTEFFTHQGFIVGEQPFFAKEGQKWVWNYDDDLTTLISCFESMKKIIGA